MRSCLTLCLFVLFGVANCAEFRVEKDDNIMIMVVPKGEKRYAINSVISVMMGTGIAWDRKSGKIEVNLEPNRKNSEFDDGFSLNEEFKANKLGVGFNKTQVEEYVKEAKMNGVLDDYVVVRGSYPIDENVVITIADEDLNKYSILRIAFIAKTSDHMISFYKIESDISAKNALAPK
jgi:hypothetical protein